MMKTNNLLFKIFVFAMAVFAVAEASAQSSAEALSKLKSDHALQSYVEGATDAVAAERMVDLSVQWSR